MKKIVSTAILLLAFCLLVCAQASADASPAALADMPAALYAEQTPDGQLALLADISVRFADTLETGGWDVDLNAVLAGELPEGFLPEDFEAAVSAEGALPEALRGLRFAALYDDKGTLRLLGDFAARLPAGTLVSSLDEAQAVLLLRHSLTSRSDYIGSAYNRHYDLYAWEIGSDTVYTLFGLTTFPPAAGRGTLSGEELGMETLWGHARDLFFDAVTVEDAYGTMTFRITGAGCYLAEVTGDRTVLEIPQEVNGYPVTGIAKCGLSGLPSLVEVCLPDTVLWIGDRAFYGCEALRTVNLPEGLESIGNYAFSYDEELQTLAFPSSLRTIGEHAFSSSSYEIKGITAFDFSEGLVSIGDYAVTGSNTLERVTLPSTLTSIGKGFLEYGGSFLWLVVPDGITKLEKDFLMSADHTLCIYLPESVGSFEDNLLDYGHITVYTPEGSAAARWAEKIGRAHV